LKTTPTPNKKKKCKISFIKNKTKNFKKKKQKKNQKKNQKNKKKNKKIQTNRFCKKK